MILNTLRRLYRILKNKYVLFTLVMVCWILFFDRYNLMRRYNDLKDLREAQAEKTYYEKQIQEVAKAKDELFSDKKKLEKFAREKYYMKKDSEDLFIVEH
jgi:hypothetical protein